MTTPDLYETSQEILKRNNIQLKAKSELKLMQFIGWIVFWNHNFMTDYWTTITLGSYRYITYPSNVTNYYIALANDSIILHECEHVKQAGNTVWSNLWFYFKYIFLPFPIYLAYFRFKYEADAYVVQIVAECSVYPSYSQKDVDRKIDQAVDDLFYDYLLPWPKPWIRSYLKKHTYAKVPF